MHERATKKKRVREQFVAPSKSQYLDASCFVSGLLRLTVGFGYLLARGVNESRTCSGDMRCDQFPCVLRDAQFQNRLVGGNGSRLTLGSGRAKPTISDSEPLLGANLSNRSPMIPVTSHPALRLVIDAGHRCKLRALLGR